jgi:prepilin-type N-terminal cleavage/methylation domain-containing protein
MTSKVEKRCRKTYVSGFTLIELLIVVLITGILVAIALPQYTLATEKSRLLNFFPMMKSIAQAKDLYTLATSQYTGDVDLLDISIPYKTKIFDGSYYHYTFDNIGGVLSVRNDNSTLTMVYSARGYTIDYFYNKPIICYAAPNSRGEKICKSVGVFRGTCSQGGANNCYTIK